VFFVETPKQDWTYVALIHPTSANQFDRGFAKLIYIPWMIHPVDSCGVEEALDVFSQTKDGGAVLG
jgi:hypothetical protein